PNVLPNKRITLISPRSSTLCGLTLVKGVNYVLSGNCYNENEFYATSCGDYELQLVQTQKEILKNLDRFILTGAANLGIVHELKQAYVLPVLNETQQGIFRLFRAKVIKSYKPKLLPENITIIVSSPKNDALCGLNLVSNTTYVLSGNRQGRTPYFATTCGDYELQLEQTQSEILKNIDRFILTGDKC
uniref:Glycosyltransferase family 9 protein n=1 Tax=Syphacia muris TaxID=451379 RepID=A0A0N5ANM6_9BILA